MEGEGKEGRGGERGSVGGKQMRTYLKSFLQVQDQTNAVTARVVLCQLVPRGRTRERERRRYRPSLPLSSSHQPHTPLPSLSSLPGDGRRVSGPCVPASREPIMLKARDFLLLPGFSMAQITRHNYDNAPFVYCDVRVAGKEGKGARGERRHGEGDAAGTTVTERLRPRGGRNGGETVRGAEF